MKVKDFSSLVNLTPSRQRLAALPALALAAVTYTLSASAEVILLNNDFEVSSGVSAGSYGSNGTSFGTDEALGNALYSDRGLEVTGTKMGSNSTYSGTGVSGGSQYLDTGNAGIRSRNTVEMGSGSESVYVFDFAFMPVAPSQNGMMVGGGLSTSSTYNAPWSTSGDNNAIFVGLDRQRNLELSGGSDAGDLIGGNSTLSLTNGEWHRLAFNLSFDGTSTWTVSNLVLENLDTPATIATVTSWSHDISSESYGTSLSSTSNVYAQVEGAYERGLDGLDNVQVIVVPEPGTFALVGLAGIAALMMARRRR